MAQDATQSLAQRESVELYGDGFVDGIMETTEPRRSKVPDDRPLPVLKDVAEVLRRRLGAPEYEDEAIVVWRLIPGSA